MHDHVSSLMSLHIHLMSLGLSTCSIRRGKVGTGESHPHTLPRAWPHRCSVSLRRRCSWGLWHGLEGCTQRPESRAMSRQRKWGSLLVDVAEGCPPVHLWFHMYRFNLLGAGIIEKNIISLLDIQRFFPLFILSSYSLKTTVWQLLQSICIVLGMLYKDEPTFQRMDVGHTQILHCL